MSWQTHAKIISKRHCVVHFWIKNSADNCWHVVTSSVCFACQLLVIVCLCVFSMGFHTNANCCICWCVSHSQGINKTTFPLQASPLVTKVRPPLNPCWQCQGCGLWHQCWTKIATAMHEFSCCNMFSLRSICDFETCVHIWTQHPQSWADTDRFDILHQDPTEMLSQSVDKMHNCYATVADSMSCVVCNADTMWFLFTLARLTQDHSHNSQFHSCTESNEIQRTLHAALSKITFSFALSEAHNLHFQTNQKACSIWHGACKSGGLVAACHDCHHTHQWVFLFFVSAIAAHKLAILAKKNKHTLPFSLRHKKRHNLVLPQLCCATSVMMCHFW